MARWLWVGAGREGRSNVRRGGRVTTTDGLGGTVSNVRAGGDRKTAIRHQTARVVFVRYHLTLRWEVRVKCWTSGIE